MKWLKRMKFWVTRQEFLDELQSVLGQVQHEMECLRRGHSVPVTMKQLEVVAQELEHLQRRAQTGALPSQDERKLAAAWYVVDSWPYDYELSERIMDLQTKYKKSL